VSQGRRWTEWRQQGIGSSRLDRPSTSAEAARGTDLQLPHRIPARVPDSVRPCMAGAPDASSHAAAKSGGGGLMGMLGKATGIRTAIQKSVM
jgi:hypothetical protein